MSSLEPGVHAINLLQLNIIAKALADLACCHSWVNLCTLRHLVQDDNSLTLIKNGCRCPSFTSMVKMEKLTS